MTKPAERLEKAFARLKVPIELRSEGVRAAVASFFTEILPRNARALANRPRYRFEDRITPEEPATYSEAEEAIILARRRCGMWLPVR